MSDTQRTDSAAVAVEGDAEGSTHEERAGSLNYRRYVRADFARQLERELADAKEYADETHARHEALVEQIARLKDENAALRADYDFLSASVSLSDWKRIEALSPEEIKAELFEQGYTQEQLDAGFAKIRKTVEDALDSARKTL